MTCTVTRKEEVDERIDGVILALDGMGWMTRRALIEKMDRMTIVAPYQTAHIDYTLQKMRLRGLVDCRSNGVFYQYRLKEVS